MFRVRFRFYHPFVPIKIFFSIGYRAIDFILGYFLLFTNTMTYDDFLSKKEEIK